MPLLSFPLLLSLISQRISDRAEFFLSLSLLRTHQLSFGLGARPCQTSAAQHIPCVGCCRMARLYIHTMRRLFVAVCSYAAPFFCCHTPQSAEIAARPGALVVALALPAVFRLALGAAGASKVVPVALGICARTPPRLVHAVSRVVAEVAARSGALLLAHALLAVRGAQLAVALVCSLLHRDSGGGCRGGVHRERKDEAKHDHGRVGSCRSTGWHAL